MDSFIKNKEKGTTFPGEKMYIIKRKNTNFTN